MTIERYGDYLAALRRPCPTATASWPPSNPSPTWRPPEPCRPDQRTYLSINRTGLAGSAFELDDRLVASVGGPPRRLDRGQADDRIALAGSERGGRRSSSSARCWRKPAPPGWRRWSSPCCGAPAGCPRRSSDIVLAAVIAHDLGAPLLKVPVPDAPVGSTRVAAVRRVVEAWASRCCSSAVRTAGARPTGFSTRSATSGRGCRRARGGPRRLPGAVARRHGDRSWRRSSTPVILTIDSEPA